MRSLHTTPTIRDHPVQEDAKLHENAFSGDSFVYVGNAGMDLHSGKEISEITDRSSATNPFSLCWDREPVETRRRCLRPGLKSANGTGLNATIRYRWESLPPRRG